MKERLAAKEPFKEEEIINLINVVVSCLWNGS
jgi:hypothetical protein